jgi:hypothetical protein
LLVCPPMTTSKSNPKSKTTKKATAKKPATKKAATKKAPAKKAPAKKAPAKKAPAKKTARAESGAFNAEQFIDNTLTHSVFSKDVNFSDFILENSALDEKTSKKWVLSFKKLFRK